MDSWLILALMGWMGAWALFCASRVVRVGETGVLVLAVTVAGLVCFGLVRWLRERRRVYRPGDRVIYVAQKVTRRPGIRAEAVHPSTAGDSYSYIVRKPWTVLTAESAGKVEVVTPGGKHRVVSVADPQLRRAGLIEGLGLRWRWHKHFPPATRV
jgi:hypothetical protein